MQKHTTDTIAKIAALPYSDERLLSTDIFQEIIDSKEQYRSYKEFKEGTISYIQKRYYFNNFDTVFLLIDKYYPISLFKYENSNMIYLNHLNKLSKCFICHRNGSFALKYWSNDCYETMFEAFDGLDKIELWNSFSRQLCMDMLVVNYLLENGMRDYHYLNGYYWLINIGDMQFDSILEKGVAENHIHINAGTYFYSIWENLMRIDINSMNSHPLMNERDKYDYNYRLSVAAIFRVIASYFLKKRANGYNGMLNQYIENSGFSDEYKKLFIEAMFKGKNLNDIDLKKIYIELMGKNKSILTILDPNESVDTTAENIFLFEALKYIKENEDDLFSCIFWKYVVLKNIIYEGITQNNYSSGLNYFQKYFRKATYRLIDKREYFKTILLNQIYNNHLDKLEIRISPPMGNKNKSPKRVLCEQLIMILDIYKEILKSGRLSKNIPQLGIVIHLIKGKDDSFFEKCWFMDDTDNRTHFYGYNQKKYLESIEIIKQLRYDIPKLSKYIVGIDAASIENDTDPWVFAPVYQEARDSKNLLMNLKEHMEPIQNLGFTFHVGEDFRHILSGLRHIHEVINHFGYHAGDRIGHGIALGINVNSWCKNNRIVVMPRIEYLENLIWLRGINSNIQIDYSYIDVEIMKQVDIIYKNVQGITINELWKAYNGKFKSFKVNTEYMKAICQSSESQHCDKSLCTRLDDKYNVFWNSEKLIHANHCKCFLERMYEGIQIKIEEKDIELYEQVQSYVRKCINTKGIVIETNPSSNLAISDIERLFQHYIVSLNQKGLVEKSTDGLIITINSDDPVVFNTSTSNELAYIFYLLQDRGYSRDSVLEWIDKVRQWGIDTSFVKDDKRSKDEIVMEINQLIERLR